MSDLIRISDRVFKILFLASVVSSMYSSKKMEGYPAGFLPSCPGSNKTAMITKDSLKHLAIVVQGWGNIFTAGHTKYNYYNIKSLATDPNVDFKRKTVMYIGGYMDSPSFPFARIIGKYYKDLGYNVLHLDMNMFTTTEYPVAVRFTRAVGKHTAEMLAILENEGLEPKDLELIAISLGAQTMSFVAKNYQLITGKNISRLTGLDPAGPCFRDLGPDERLDQSDANFVDVIDTNIDGYGIATPIGHVNFYVNGGEYQVGDVAWIPCSILCSHIRSFTIWISALQHPKGFVAMQCDSVQQARDKNCYDRKPRVTNVVGLKTDQKKQGIFYLPTTNRYPYYMGQKGLKKDNEYITKLLSKLNESNVMKM